jgi:hypothetical protein
MPRTDPWHPAISSSWITCRAIRLRGIREALEAAAPSCGICRPTVPI